MFFFFFWREEKGLGNRLFLVHNQKPKGAFGRI